MFCIGEYVYETVVMNHNKSYMKIYREIEQESSLFPFVLFFRVVENDELYNHLLYIRGAVNCSQQMVALIFTHPAKQVQVGLQCTPLKPSPQQ